MERLFYLATVATIPALVCWIVGYGVEGGFWVALQLFGPVLAIVYPPIAVWMMLIDARTRGNGVELS